MFWQTLKSYPNPKIHFPNFSSGRKEFGTCENSFALIRDHKFQFMGSKYAFPKTFSFPDHFSLPSVLSIHGSVWINLKCKLDVSLRIAINSISEMKESLSFGKRNRIYSIPLHLLYTQRIINIWTYKNLMRKLESYITTKLTSVK